MASIWRHPRSQYWTACIRDSTARQRRVSTKGTNRSADTKLQHLVSRHKILAKTVIKFRVAEAAKDAVLGVKK
jgi:hypothetical protein